MDLLNDRIGFYIIKENNYIKNYFYIDNNGKLYSTQNEDSILKIIKTIEDKEKTFKNKTVKTDIDNHKDNLNYSSYYFNNNDNITIMNSFNSSLLNLSEYSITSINKYTDDNDKNSNIKINNDSYFTLLNNNNNKKYTIFSYDKENTLQLYSYFKSFCSLNYSNINEDNNNNNNDTISNNTSNKNSNNNNNNKNTDNLISKSNSNMINNIKLTNNITRQKTNTSLIRLDTFNDLASMNTKYKPKDFDDIVNKKLLGKFVNQKDWKKPNIKTSNPSIDSNDEHHEEWIELENKSHYSGIIKNNMPNGNGKEYRSDGLIYTGSFLDGKWHGLGTLTNENLDSVSGEFINGCICGI